MIKEKPSFFGGRVLLQGLFYLFLSLFLLNGQLHAQEKKDATATSAKQESASSPNNQKSTSNKEEKALPEIVTSDEALFSSDVDSEKAMENALQEMMLSEVKMHYPMIRSITLESDEESIIMEIAYDQISDRDTLQIKPSLIKNKMRAEIIVNTPLLQKKDDMKLEGDHELLESVHLIPDPQMSSKLGADTKVFFVKQIEFEILRPVRWKVKQTPGVLKVEFRPYVAGDEEDEEDTEQKEEDILFQPPSMEGVQEVLGESYALEQKYENQLVSGGETTLIEDLNENLSNYDFPQTGPDYSQGISEDIIVQEMKERYPTFGSLKYWQKHLSAVLSNTTRFIKRQRNHHPILNVEPGMAIAYQRRGRANVQLGYGLQRELPFFYTKLGRQAPMDGFMRHDIYAGIAYKTQSPWTYSIQNRLNIGTSENLGSPNKYGDRLTSYNYELGNGILYNFRRGHLRLGAGMRVQAEEAGVNEDISTYLSSTWVRPFSKTWATRMEYQYERVFLHDPKPVRDFNIHKARFGLEYRPTRNISFQPTWGLAFYDAEAFYGMIGGMKYEHQLNSRSQITANYVTDFIRRPLATFGSESLKNSRPTVTITDALIRYQDISVVYEHIINKRTKLILSGGYSYERQLEVKRADKYHAYRAAIALNHRIKKDWEVEIKYTFNYLDAYQLSAITTGEGGDIIKRDTGNTDYSLYLKILRYINGT